MDLLFLIFFRCFSKMVDFGTPFEIRWGQQWHQNQPSGATDHKKSRRVSSKTTLLGRPCSPKPSRSAQYIIFLDFGIISDPGPATDRNEQSKNHVFFKPLLGHPFSHFFFDFFQKWSIWGPPSKSDGVKNGTKISQVTRKIEKSNLRAHFLAFQVLVRLRDQFLIDLWLTCAHFLQFLEPTPVDFG